MDQANNSLAVLMLLAYICNVIMVAFVLDSSFDLSFFFLETPI